jgi:hypothetical protein
MNRIILCGVLVAVGLVSGCSGDGAIRADIAGANIEIAKRESQAAFLPIAETSVPMPGAATSPAALALSDYLRALAVAFAGETDPDTKAWLAGQMETASAALTASTTITTTLRNPSPQSRQVAQQRDEWAGVVSDGIKTAGTIGGIVAGGRAAKWIVEGVSAGISGALQAVPDPVQFDQPAPTIVHADTVTTDRAVPIEPVIVPQQVVIQPPPQQPSYPPEYLLRDPVIVETGATQ